MVTLFLNLTLAITLRLAVNLSYGILVTVNFLWRVNFTNFVLCEELTSLIVVSWLDWCDGRNDVTDTSIIICLLDVDYCRRLDRAFRAIMLGVNTDAFLRVTSDRTAFDEQWNWAVHIEDIYGPTDFLCTSKIHVLLCGFFAILHESSKRLATWNLYVA